MTAAGGLRFVQVTDSALSKNRRDRFVFCVRRKEGRKEGKRAMLSGQLGAVRPVLLTVAFRSCVGGGAGVHGQLGHAVLVACKCNIY